MKWTKRTGYFLLSLITAILFLYLSAAWVVHKALENGRLHTWLSESLGNNIDYEVVDVVWSMGSAFIALKQLEVFHEEEVLINIPELDLHIDVFRSLWNFKLIFNQVELKNLVFKLKKAEAETPLTEWDQAVLTIQEIWPWLEPQKAIVIHQAKVLSDQGQPWLEHLNLSWHHHSNQSIHMKAQAVFMAVEHHPKLSLEGEINPSLEGVLAQLKLSAQDLKFNLEQHTLELAGQAQVEISHDRQIVMQTQGDLSFYPKNRAAIATEKFQWGIAGRFSLNANTLKAENVYFKLLNPWVQAHLEGELESLWTDFLNPALHVQGDLHLKDFHQALVLLEVLKPTNPKLMDWLFHNIFKIPEAQALFEWKGHLQHYPIGQSTAQAEFFSLKGQFKEAEFFPDQGWPLVQGASPNIEIHNDSLLLSTNQAHSLNVSASNVLLELRDWVDDLAVMQIKIASHATADQVRAYLLETPLDLTFFNYLYLKGLLDSQVVLNIPLDPRPIQVLSEVELEGLELYFESNPSLVVQNIRGHLSLIDDAIQTKAPIEGQLWGKMVQGQFTEQSVEQGGGNRLDVWGRLPLPLFVESWIGSGFAHLIEGDAPFQLSYLRYKDHFILDSTVDLTSAFVNPPKPYSPYSFQDYLKLKVTGDENHLIKSTANLAHFMQADLRLDLKAEQPKPVGHIQILTDRMTETQQLQVNLHLPQFNEDSMAWLLDQLNMSAPRQDFLQFIIALDQVDLYGQSLQNAQVTIDPEPGGTLLKLNHSTLTGTAFFSNLEDDPILVNIAHMEWLRLHSDDSFAESLKVNPQFYPASIPEMDINIEDLVLNHRPVGSLTAQIRQQENGVLFQEIKWVHGHFESVIMGDWVRTQAETQSSILGLSGRISGGSWEGFLKDLGYEVPPFKANQGQMDFVLTWNGAPYQFNLNQAGGSLNFDLKEGALSGVNPLISRFVDLMNISSINSRLQLSASSIRGDDLIFDHFSGQYTLESGVLKTHNAYLLGPSMDLTMIGAIDLNHKTLDQKIRVKPHLGSSMALVAGVIGGPVAGVATWVADKIVGNTLLKDQVMTYRVEGPWDHYTLDPVAAE